MEKLRKEVEKLSVESAKTNQSVMDAWSSSKQFLIKIQKDVTELRAGSASAKMARLEHSNSKKSASEDESNSTLSRGKIF